ncbi:MAG: SUMF1/EgtB/PvdO family nonheme iron enzyme [Elusimicrobiota bacterium]
MAINFPMKGFIPVLFLALTAVPAAVPAGALDSETSWPDVSRPARAVGGGEHDAAVVVGVENYFAVPGVPGAEANANAWYDYLTKTRDVAPGRVKLLRGNDATRDEMLEAAQTAAAKAGPQGTLWFIFIGHGAPSSDGKDGLLVGVDAQQKAKSLQTQSLKRGELLKALGASRAGKIVVVLDACFSGRGSDGESIAPGLQPLVTVAAGGVIDPRMAVLTAAKGDQFAGALPGTQRPAFSYLVLGGLRGWAGQAKVTAGDLWRYASTALDATLTGRNQTPDLIGKEGVVVGATSGEKGPDLAALAKATAGGGSAGGGFQVTNLPAVPKAQAPKALASDTAGSLNFRNLDIEALTKKSETVKLDKSDAAAEEKAQAWRDLAKDVPQFADKAVERAAQWDAFAAQEKAVEEAKQKRIEARDSDWGKLSALLALDEAVVPEISKTNWSGEFLRAYWKSPGVGPAMAKALAAHMEAGAMQEALKKLALKAHEEEVQAGGASGSAARPPRATADKAGIQWVRIPGGSFTMGYGGVRADEKPAHQVTVKSFELTKTLVTNKQYKACVAAGACLAAHVSDRNCYVSHGSNWDSGNLPDSFQSDDQPVVCVTWGQAKAYAQWVGGRLPSEAEWEYAARSAGKDWKYPWGNEDVTCERAVINEGGLGCGKNSTWPVCSKAKGNSKQGLCDMAGNAWQWTQDGANFSYAGAPTDGSAWNDRGPYRVFRGGSWRDVAANVRSANRRDDDAGHRSCYDYVGIRPARDSRD